MSCVNRVLIVGGGIGGLTVATALRKQNIEVVIAEIKRDWTVSGVGIIQPANMLRALEQIGLAAECLKSGGAFNSFVMHNHLGQKMIEAQGPAIQGFPAFNGISRRDLHRILSNAVIKADIEVNLGLTVDAITQDDDGCSVLFSNGVAQQFDLVIGADGVNSKVRSLSFSNHIEPQFSGQAVWRYVAQRPEGMDNAMFFFGPPESKTKAGFVPISASEMYLLLVTQEPGNPEKPSDQLAAMLRDKLQGYGDFVSNVKESITDSSAVVYRPLIWALQPEWVNGRVVLLGDAAHAMTPHMAQGAAMAIEDAIVLSEELVAAKAVSQALVAYLSRRVARASRVLETSVQLGEWEMRPTATMTPAKLSTETEQSLGEAI